MRIVLVRPPKLLVKGTLSMSTTPPLGLAYIASALLEDRHQVSVIDAIAMGIDTYYDSGLGKDIIMQGLSFEDIANQIPSDVEMIGLSCMFSNNWLLDKMLIDFLAKRYERAILVAGGESISSMPEYVLENSSLHISVVGEGEETIKNLAQTIINKEDFKNVSGIVFKSNDTIIKNRRNERIRDLDSIALPAWELFPMDIYFKHQLTWTPTEHRSIPLLTTRGCPYTCTFCSSPNMWTTKYSLRKPQKILDEMNLLYERFGIENFELYDLTAIINRHWIIELCKLLQQNPQKFTWQMPPGTRSEAVNSEVITELSLAGCTGITFAPESGSAEVLKNIQKKAKPENMLPLMKAASQEGMYVYINMIIGLPGETHKDIWHSIFFLMKAAVAGANDVSAGVFMPYPGTVLFNELRNEKRLSLDTEYFYNILYIDSYGNSKFYNAAIPSSIYRFYNILIMLAFYSCAFLLHPSRVYKLVKNVLGRTYVTRSERALGRLLDQIFKISTNKTIEKVYSLEVV